MINEQTRLIDVTVGELIDYIKDNVKLQPETPQEVEEDKWIYGLKAFAKQYGLSLRAANTIRHKKELKDADAVVKSLRKIKFNKAKCDELFAQGVF